MTKLTRRAYHLRLGFIRAMYYPHGGLWSQRHRVVPMTSCRGVHIGGSTWQVQIALHWWGFGKDGGS